jgi:hypothetical protein
MLTKEEIIKEVLKEFKCDCISCQKLKLQKALQLQEQNFQLKIKELEDKLKEETRHFDGWCFSNDAKEFRKIIDKVFSEYFGEEIKKEVGE